MQAGIYKHYKGGYYQVLGVAEHTETHERVVVYVSLTGIAQSGPRIRVRPLEGPEGFASTVQIRVQHDLRNEVVERFKWIGDEL